MAADAEAFHWEPAQDFPKQTIDLRELAANTARGHKVGPSSTANTVKTQPAVKKRKREDAEASQQDDMDAETTSGVAPSLAKMRRTCKRDVVGVTSDRSWKVPAAQKHSASLGRTAKTWEHKMQEKQRKKLHQVAALEAREAYKSMLRERREQHEAAKQKKEDNRKSNDAKHGVALSSAAAKKMLKNKKLRKQVVVA